MSETSSSLISLDNAAEDALDNATVATASARNARALRHSRREGWLRSPAFWIGIAIIAFWTMCALVGRDFVPFDPYATDLLTGIAPPDATHWFGTDPLGRDVFSRVIVGSHDILIVAPLATLLGVAVGTLVGLALGYLGGLLDAIAGRVLDAMMSLPLVVLALMALAAGGSSKLAVIVVIGLVYVPLVARTVRSAVRTQRALDYVGAARLGGAGALSIMFTEILPNVRQPVLIESIIRLGYAFFTVGTLSFLGLGIQPPSPDWGLAIAEGSGLLVSGFWWVVVFNSLAIISLVIATNLIADAFGAFD